MIISLPAAFRKAFVHFTLRGFRFILKVEGKFRKHIERGNRSITVLLEVLMASEKEAES